MESPFLYVELDHTGRIWQLRDKENGTEFVDISSPMNELRLYKNVNFYYDAWEIGRMYEQEEEELDRTIGKSAKQNIMSARHGFCRAGSESPHFTVYRIEQRRQTVGVLYTDRLAGMP